MRLCLLALLAAIGVALADCPEPKDSKPADPREIKVKGLPGGKGLLGKPEKIAGKEDLEKTVADKDARAEIAKQVNFKKEYLLLFRWSGSGGDRLTPSVEKGKTVVFNYTRGRTRDLRRHVKLFAVPVGMAYKVKH